MVRPIPKRLLIHTVEYEHFAGNNGWDDSWEKAVTINNVRVEATTRLQRVGDSEGEQVQHVLIVDRKHSSLFPEFKVKSRVTFNGISREVVDVKPFYTFGSEPHHYEIELN